MPVASSIVAAGIGAVGAIGSAALAPKGKKAAAAGAAGQQAAAASNAIGNAAQGLMAPSSSGGSGIAAAIVGSPINYKKDGEFRIPDNPAYQLVNKVDEIFRPTITKVEDD